MGGFPAHHFHILSKKLLYSPFFIFTPASTSLVAEGRVQSNWPFSPIIDETINFLHTSMICAIFDRRVAIKRLCKEKGVEKWFDQFN